MLGDVHAVVREEVEDVLSPSSNAVLKEPLPWRGTSLQVLVMEIQKLGRVKSLGEMSRSAS